MTNVNSTANLEIIVTSATGIQNKWAEVANKTMMVCNEPDFEELLSFAQEWDRVVYGHEKETGSKRM